MKELALALRVRGSPIVWWRPECVLNALPWLIPPLVVALFFPSPGPSGPSRCPSISPSTLRPPSWGSLLAFRSMATAAASFLAQSNDENEEYGDDDFEEYNEDCTLRLFIFCYVVVVVVVVYLLLIHLSSFV